MRHVEKRKRDCARLATACQELQWMANYRSDLVSDLKMVWEQYLGKAGRITLVLCGS